MFNPREMFRRFDRTVESAVNAYYGIHIEGLETFLRSRASDPYIVGSAVVSSGLLFSALATGNRELVAPGAGILLAGSILYAYKNFLES